MIKCLVNICVCVLIILYFYNKRTKVHYYVPKNNNNVKCRHKKIVRLRRKSIPFFPRVSFCVVLKKYILMLFVCYIKTLTHSLSLFFLSHTLTHTSPPSSSCFTTLFSDSSLFLPPFTTFQLLAGDSISYSPHR